MMKAELKAKWIAALKSGQYPQGRLNFERDNRYCCLGVLCVVIGVSPTVHDRGNWLAVSSHVGDPVDLLATMNDTGYSFKEIADWIERNIQAES